MRIIVAGSSFTIIKDQPFNVELEIDGVLEDGIVFTDDDRSILKKAYAEGYEDGYEDGYTDGEDDGGEL